MFFVIDKSKIFSYAVAICTVVILFVVAATLDTESTENAITTSSNIVENNISNVNTVNNLLNIKFIILI